MGHYLASIFRDADNEKAEIHEGYFSAPIRSAAPLRRIQPEERTKICFGIEIATQSLPGQAILGKGRKYLLRQTEAKTTLYPAAPKQKRAMSQIPLYPLRFEPIYQYRLWGGRHLADLLTAPLPGDGPIGEAWLLSDRDDHPSKVADGPLHGSTIRQLLEQSPGQLMGKLAGRFRRFPVLLKFLDAHEKLSVQVHPKDGQMDYIPVGESGKTEAWVVLKAEPASRIYAGLKPGTTPNELRRSLANRTVADDLASFTPRVGDSVLLQAGTVHSLSGLVVFEVQQNSDVTFRLYDWDRIDSKTGKPRPLQIEQAFACTDFKQVAIGPVTPAIEETVPVLRERLFQCGHFSVWRHRGQSPFTVGAMGLPRVLVCLGGEGSLEHEGATYAAGKGDVLLLPAVVGVCTFRPRSEVSLLQVALPEQP